MNKAKRKLKGFTLIELIIVLALFSVIMTLVMSFIDPVSRLMTKTSMRERTSAYVDNIDEYITKSIRHAQNINVYENGLYIEGEPLPATAAEAEVMEARIVREFVDNYYDGAISFDGTDMKPLTGKVHILKLINNTVDGLEAGHIYETVYNFTAGLGDNTSDSGMTYLDPKKGYAKVPESITSSKTQTELEAMGYIAIQSISYHESDSSLYKEDNENFFHHAKVAVTGSANIPVLNPENFKEYSYYYKLGMNSFQAIGSPEGYMLKSGTINANAITALNADNFIFSDQLNKNRNVIDYDKFFYSRLVKSPVTVNTSDKNLVLSVVSFVNDKAYSKLSCEYVNGTDVEDVTLFKSASAMSSIGITFKNAAIQDDPRALKFYRKKIKPAGVDKSTGVVEIKDSNIVLEAVRGDATFTKYPPLKIFSEGDSENIYFIYTIPDEVNDTKWDLTGKSPTPSTPSGC